ncbi:MAG TPA: hypothetical protein VGL68_03725 [Solirubrobacteraceae bacterium]|jgi:hypothetical protein
MRTRPFATGLLLGLAALILVLTTTASAYLYKKPAGHDCGKATLIGGFGGPAPSNVPADAKPEIHTFIVKGKISCTVAKQVMDKFEKSFVTSPGKGLSPAGWKCGFSAKLKGQSCTDSKHVVLSNGIVYVTPKA